ncbi:MAG TPA: YaeQ family protein [Candidatus Omnitrophota bacterium]|nr:YaeQ family protein [Candidatus Omnitrophota bacterium]
MIEKFSFELESPKINQKLVLVKAESERREHVVLKMLSYLLFYEPGLQIEAEIGMHYKPDLVVPGDYGVPKLWIDCGDIALRKVRNLSAKLRNTRFVLVKASKSELEKFKRVMEDKVEHYERIEYLSFDKGFVDSIADSLERTNDVTLYEVMEGVIGVALHGRVFESALYH